jgi:Fic family protein
MATERHPSTNEAQIRALLDERVRAIHEKDIAPLVSAAFGHRLV